MDKNIDEALQKAMEDIAMNHRKIIDDWCKAYCAQIYKETGSIKPGDFILNQQALDFKAGHVGYRYWFEPKDKET